MKKSKFWNITANDNDAPASLLLYGELSNETWFGDEVTPRAFHDDLQSLGGKISRCISILLAGMCSPVRRYTTS